MATVTISPARSRPFVEFLLLLLAVSVGLGGYALTYLNRTEELPANIWWHALFLVVFALVAHLGVRYLAPHADPVILPLAVGPVTTVSSPSGKVTVISFSSNRWSLSSASRDCSSTTVSVSSVPLGVSPLLAVFPESLSLASSTPFHLNEPLTIPRPPDSSLDGWSLPFFSDDTCSSTSSSSR